MEQEHATSKFHIEQGNLQGYCYVCSKVNQSKSPKPMSSSDSSFSSSFFSSSFGGSAAAAAVPDVGAAEPAAGAPPEPTLDNSSLMFFPSRALARRLHQMDSISTFAACTRVLILADVISRPSSARMSAAYVGARSADAYVKKDKVSKASSVLVSAHPSRVPYLKGNKRQSEGLPTVT